MSFAETLTCRDVFLKPNHAVEAQNDQFSFNKELAQEMYQHFGDLVRALSKVDPQQLLKDGKIRFDLINDLSEKATLPQEKVLLKKMARLVDSGQTEAFIRQWVQFISEKAEQDPWSNFIRKLSIKEQSFIATNFATAIKSATELRGLTRSSGRIKYKEWNKLSKEISKKIEDSPRGIENLLYFAKTEWMQTKKAELLVNGKASFARREELMDKAKKSIEVLTWAIYDDMTGFQFVDQLIARHKAGVEVKVIVDGQVAQLEGYREALKKLEDNNVKLIRWFGKEKSFLGQHRKMMIFDGQHIVAGGINIGDVYSHKNPNPKVARWRDTDIYLGGGPILKASQNLFRRLWNEQVEAHGLKFEIIPEEISKEISKDLEELSLESDSVQVALLDHTPSETTAGSTILMTLLKGLREAESSIDIENAYVILFPALKREIARALHRGVKVRVLTNSGTSVDEPLISVPMLRSAKQIFGLGAQVFLKKGDTLHSKMAIIDGKYTFLMSYNLHPRSERLEGEMAFVVDDKNFAARAKQVFNNDISADQAQFISHESQIEMPNSFIALVALRIFFDLL